MKRHIKLFKCLTIIALSIFILGILASCEKEETQTSTPVTENTIEGSSEITTLMTENAQDNLDDKGCISFQFPISFSVYNKEFQIAETLPIKTNDQLITFLEALDEISIITINFPVTLEVNGSAVVIESTEKLRTLLRGTSQNCDVTPNCSIDKLLSSFTKCPMYITAYNESDSYTDYKITFEENSFQISQNNINTFAGAFTITEDDNRGFIIEMRTNWDVINGIWTIVDCTNFSDHTLTNDKNTMRLQGCDYEPTTNPTDPFSCFKDFENKELCDENLDGREPFDLTTIYKDCSINPDFLTITYHTSEIDAEENNNPIQSPEKFVITSNSTTLFARTEFINTSSKIKINVIKLGLTSCGTDPAPDDCTIDSTRNVFWECPMFITSYNNDTSKYENYKFIFLDISSILEIYENDKIIERGTFEVSETTDDKFTITLESEIAEFNGTWTIDECDNFKVPNLTRKNDRLILKGC